MVLKCLVVGLYVHWSQFRTQSGKALKQDIGDFSITSLVSSW